MKNLKWLFFVVLSLGTCIVYGQSGTVRGVVIDDATGETIIGGTVVVQDLGTGTSTDLDGQFSLSLDAGTYTLQVSYIGYATITD
jgi:propanediol dehydratase small subunit